MRKGAYLLILLLSGSLCYAQLADKKQKNVDTSFAFDIILDTIVVSKKIDVSDLIRHLKNDTTFYKAFKNLNVLNYQAIVNGRMYDPKGDNQVGAISSRMEQTVSQGCVTKKITKQKIIGKLKNRKGEYVFYTCKMFKNLFLDEGTKCNQTNVINNKQITLDNVEGLDKRIEQIKMLVFNPGQRIPGLFFFGNKVAIFEDKLMRRYDYEVDKVSYHGKDCILFTIKAKKDLNIFQRSDIVIDELITWLDAKTWEIVAKKYTLSYDFGFVSFDITMEVDVKKYKDYLHPSNIRYNGKWNVPFYKRENGYFNVVLHSFNDANSNVK